MITAYIFPSAAYVDPFARIWPGLSTTNMTRRIPKYCSTSPENMTMGTVLIVSFSQRLDQSLKQLPEFKRGCPYVVDDADTCLPEICL